MRLWFLLPLLLWACPAESLPLTRAQASQLALASHPKLRAGIAQVIQAREQVEIAAAPGHPQVNLTMSRLAQQTTQGIPVQTTLFGIPQNFQSDSINYQQSRFALEVRQLLYDGGELVAQLHQLQALKEQAYENLLAQAYQLHLDTQLAYLELAEARQRVQAAQAALQVAERSLEMTRARYQAGSAAEADIVYIQVDAARARLSVQEARRRVALGEFSLNRLIGLPQTTPLELQDELLGAPQPPADLAQALQNRPELRALERQQSAARFAVEHAGRGSGPKIYGVGGAEGVGYGRDVLPTSPGWRVAVELSWPVYDGGLAEHQEARAQAQLDEATARLEEARQDIELQVRKAQADLDVAREALRLTVAQQEQTRKALDMAMGQYSVGYATILQVSQAQSNHLTADTQLAAAQQDVARAQLRLDYAMGKEPPGWDSPYRELLGPAPPGRAPSVESRP